MGYGYKGIFKTSSEIRLPAFIGNIEQSTAQTYTYSKYNRMKRLLTVMVAINSDGLLN